MGIQWFTHEHLTGSILSYLKHNGLKAYREETVISGRMEIILFVIGKGHREIIEIKTHLENSSVSRSGLLINAARSQTLESYSLNLLSSLASLSNQYKNEKLPVSLCIPDLRAYREVIREVEENFILNNIEFNIYLVKESGSVEEINFKTDKCLQPSGTNIKNRTV